MSAICQRFVQNAWRSDLCSNCFKSLEDHSQSTADRNHLASVQRYVPQATSLYQSRGISTNSQWRTVLNQSSTTLYDRVPSRDFGAQTAITKHHHQVSTTDTSHKSILKESAQHKSSRRRSSVGFSSEEALVIGYGGRDYDSDDSFELGSDDGSIDLEQLDLTDEDRKVTRLTKDNTEFNSYNKNLLESKKDRIDTNNNINSALKKSDKNMSVIGCLTYNDIKSQAPEKKVISQYYFSTKEEPLQSHLYGNKSPNSQQTSKPNGVIKNEDAIHSSRKPDVIMNLKIENQNQKGKTEKCQILLTEDYTPLNTMTYSFVSKISQKPNNLDQGSDSDYSTSRQTNGESTDTDSFPDSDDVRVMPCQSFLHGTRSDSQRICKDGSDDYKTYDAGSSTSGDISNFSDDSDSQTSPEVASGTSISSNKTSPSSGAVKSPIIKDNRVNVSGSISSTNLNCSRLTSPSKESPTVNAGSKSGNCKTSSANVTVNCSVVKANKCDTNKAPPRDNTKQNVQIDHKSSPVDEQICKKVSPSNEKLRSAIETRPQESSPSVKTSYDNSPNNRDVAVGIHNNKTVSTDCKQRQNLDGNTRSVINLCEVVSSNKQVINAKHSQTSTPNVHDNRTLTSQSLVIEDKKSPGSQNPLNITNRDVYDIEDASCPVEDTLRTPDDKHDRQSKLAALALELERARCDTAMNPEPMATPIISHLHPAKCPPNKPPPDIPYSTIRRNSGIPSSAKLTASPLPDVLQDTKPKKSRFSLKKLLKRNSKDYESPPGISNPKAWKNKQNFDRSRLSLDIVHPMEMVSSTETTPTEEQASYGIFADPKGRARSLSALPYLAGQDDSYARKAGTVAERKKKSRPLLVRTPSCSALHNRPATQSAATPHRPPKPPPPPRINSSQAPPPPPPQSRIAKLANGSPARPPPPKIPESHAKIYSSPVNPNTFPEFLKCNVVDDGEYANLGDIRSFMTPKKPERPSATSGTRGNETGAGNPDDTYETLEAADEEDHYTYLDDSEMKCPKIDRLCSKDSVVSTLSEEPAFDGQPPWLNLQASYSAIAAALYESLSDLTTTVLHEDIECFQKLTSTLKWKDFYLESEKPDKIIDDKIIFNALHKNLPQIKVTLMVTMHKQVTTQANRNQTRLPVLTSFSDSLPGHLMQPKRIGETINAHVYVLQRSKVTTIEQFSTERTQVHQYTRLRDDCFVMLQLIHTLKSLQADGIEELSSEIRKVFLVQTDVEKPPTLVLLPGDKINLLHTVNGHNVLSLCQTTLQMLLHLLQVTNVKEMGNCIVNGEPLAEQVSHTFSAIAKVLVEEKASSLTQAKGLLEHMLWGPVDVQLDTDGVESVDEILQRWLDLQRAQMVKSLVSNSNLKFTLQEGLHIYEEYQLLFLLQASVKSLRDILSKL